MHTRLSAMVWAVLLTGALWGQAPSTANPPAGPDTKTVLKTTVRRVVLDVTVTDATGAPVPGLTAADFTVDEDGQPQQILSFDANGFSAGMDYIPPPLPPEPPNTFINLPSTPEKGPLYVLLYDLVNMDSADQMDSPGDHRQQLVARQQVVKFVREAPEGARFAIFVRSDALHLVQGFTSDKALIYRAMDPQNPPPHFPKVFLSAENFGRGDRLSALYTLQAVATYLNGLPGRKNLIWFSSQFPPSLFASDTEGQNFQDETKATLDLMAHDEIAIYPVDARGVAAQDSHDQLGTSVHSDTITSPTESGGTAGAAAAGGASGGSSPSQTSSFVQGSSAVINSYQNMDAIARETGGEAFYSDNDVAGQLLKATRSGAVYYTLTYSPTNRDYNGRLRHIEVQLAKKGYALAYRRSYFGTDTAAPKPEAPEAAAVPSKPVLEQRPVGDTLSGNMLRGAPTAHQLIFVVKAKTVGAPTQGTPEEMAELATEPAYFQSRRKSAPAKPLSPILLQKHVFSFDIPIRQFATESSLDLEVAAAVYDADGQMMNAFVRTAKKDLGAESAATGEPRFFRIEQDLEVPLSATSVRFAVRDIANDRIGAMEVKLPLAPETSSAIK